MNKRLVFGALAGVTAFAAVNGSAASLGTITTPGLGAGSAVVASCDTAGVTTAYTTAYDGTGAKAYEVATVNVSKIADACSAKQIKVSLVAANASLLGQATAPVPSIAAGAEGSLDLDFSASNVLAGQVEGIHVTIGG